MTKILICFVKQVRDDNTLDVNIQILKVVFMKNRKDVNVTITFDEIEYAGKAFTKISTWVGLSAQQ